MNGEFYGRAKRAAGQAVRVSCVVASVIAALASASPPKPQGSYAVAKTADVQHSRDDTWSALVDVFADHNWPIDNIDKDSGIITTDWMNTGNEGESYADCGESGLASKGPVQVKFNVRVKGNAQSSSMTVNATFRRTLSFGSSVNVRECSSKGSVESIIQQETTLAARRGAKDLKPATRDAGVSDSGAIAPP